MKDDSFSKFVFASFILHLCIVIIYTVKAVLLPTETIIYEPAMRVDLIALPEKITEPQIPTPTEEIKESQKLQEKINVHNEIPQKEDVVLKSDKDIPKVKTDSAIAKIKESMAIDKIKKLMGENKESQTQLTETKNITYKGNILSPGTELKGLNKLQHETYEGDLDRHVKKFWMLPEWMAKKNYSTRVRIYLDEKGFLTRVRIVLSSGFKEYDDLVIDSIKKAVPYPPPPAKFKDMVDVDGVLLGFPE